MTSARSVLGNVEQPALYHRAAGIGSGRQARASRMRLGACLTAVSSSQARRTPARPSAAAATATTTAAASASKALVPGQGVSVRLDEASTVKVTASADKIALRFASTDGSPAVKTVKVKMGGETIARLELRAADAGEEQAGAAKGLVKAKAATAAPPAPKEEGAAPPAAGLVQKADVKAAANNVVPLPSIAQLAAARGPSPRPPSDRERQQIEQAKSKAAAAAQKVAALAQRVAVAAAAPEQAAPALASAAATAVAATTTVAKPVPVLEMKREAEAAVQAAPAQPAQPRAAAPAASAPSPSPAPPSAIDLVLRSLAMWRK